MRDPHKHAAMIIDWANGAEVESRDPREGTPWEDVGNRPGWYEQLEYRIKPVPRVSDVALDLIQRFMTEVQIGNMTRIGQARGDLTDYILDLEIKE